MEMPQIDEILVEESAKLKPGEIVIGRIRNAVIQLLNGENKVVSTFYNESEIKDNLLIHFPGTPLIADGISGVANTDKIKQAKKESQKPHPFNIKRGLAYLKEKMEIESIMGLVNRGSVIYEYDELGRVYFNDQFGNRYYVQPNLLGCITEDRSKFYEMIPTRDAFTMQEGSDADLAYFEYLYVSKRYRELAKKMIDANSINLDNYTPEGQSRK